MNKKMIVVQGYLAAGKSVFARRVSGELGIPCFIKDTFKTALCAGIEIENQKTSSLFSAVTFEAIMYAAERLMEAGLPLLIEGNFLPAGIKKTDEAGRIRALIEGYDYRSLTFRFIGEPGILYRRFIAREGTPERGRANTMFTAPTAEAFEALCRNMDGFRIGGAEAEIDSSDFARVDFTYYTRMAREFLLGSL